MTQRHDSPSEDVARDRLDELIGPYFTQERVAEWLHSSEEHVKNLTARDDLVSVPGAESRRLYPAFQFDRNERILPHVAWVLRLIDPEGVDPWGSALWLNAVNPTFGDLTAAEALRQGKCHLVLDAARAANAEWRRT